MRPWSIGYIKGWKRSLSLLVALQGIKECGLESDIPHRIRVPE